MGLHALEGAPFVENRPGDTGELVGERNRQHVMMQAQLGCLDPGFEPVALPTLWPNPGQHHLGCLNKQGAQITIAAPGYAAEDGDRKSVV